MQLHGHTDDNAFWPGHLLNKIALHMPQSDPPSGAVFSRASRGKQIYPSNNTDLRAWDVSDQGYIKYGSLEQDKKYTVH